MALGTTIIRLTHFHPTVSKNQLVSFPDEFRSSSGKCQAGKDQKWQKREVRVCSQFPLVLYQTILQNQEEKIPWSRWMPNSYSYFILHSCACRGGGGSLHNTAYSQDHQSGLLKRKAELEHCKTPVFLEVVTTRAPCPHQRSTQRATKAVFKW